MTDDIKEEAEQVAEVLTKSMGAGKFIKDFIKSRNPRFAGKSKEKRKEMALGAFYSKEEVEQVVAEATNIKNVSGLKKVSSHGDFDLHKGKGDDHLLVHRETGEVHHAFSGKTLDVKKFLKNYEFENLPRPAKEEVSFDESNDFKQGFLDDYNVLRGHKNPEVKKHLTAAEINFKNENFQNAHSYMQKAKNAARTSKQANEEVEAVDEVTMRRTIPTKQERDAANKYYANHNHELSAEKRRAGIENYPGREDPIIGNLKGTFKKNSEKDKAANEEVEQVDEVSLRKTNPTKAEKETRYNYYKDSHAPYVAAKHAAGMTKPRDENINFRATGNTGIMSNPYRSNKFKPATLMSFKAGLSKAAAKANEEVSLDEGRGRPPKEGSAAWKKRQSEGGGDSDTPGLHGQLIKHKSLQNAPPKIKFTNGEEAHISAEHRDRAIKHLEGMIGPGKNPQARDNAVKAMSHSHAGFKQAIGVESKPEEKKSSMSAQRDKPKLSLTKEESEMSQEDIVEKLQAALDAGILSQNDFDKLTQTEEVEAVDEKALSSKQKKIAAVAGDPDKIDAEDFKKLRKEETTAGVAAVVAALSRNLKELK